MNFDVLPIGTIVELKDVTVPVIIGGYLMASPNKKGKVWDYAGFVFPYGYVTEKEILSFDHDRIVTVIAYGYRDLQQERFADSVVMTRQEILEKLKGEEK